MHQFRNRDIRLSEKSVPPSFEAMEPRTLMSATFGGQVWEDLNANGVRDNGEGAIAGAQVMIDLLTNTGGYLATTFTDANGNYSFTDLAPGTYRAHVIPPTGYEATASNVGGDDTIDSDLNEYGEIPNTTLADGESNLTLDAGYFRRASLGDRVWEDSDKDGVQDANEKGLAGVLVDLLTPGGAYLASATTDAQGRYRFENLVPGSYKLHVIAPLGYVQTVSNVGNDARDSDLNQYGETTPVTVLQSGQSVDHVDAGFHKAASVAKGQAAGAGFWVSTKGQNLIKSLNGGSSSTALSSYLAENYGNLYGSGAGAMNLAGKTNAQVASLYKSLASNLLRLPEAQVMAIAISTYVTDSDLAGNAAKAYGFKVDANGLANANLNLGLLGPVYGLPMFSNITVGQLLTNVDRSADNGVLFRGSFIGRVAATLTFTGIALAGDVD